MCRSTIKRSPEHMTVSPVGRITSLPRSMAVMSTPLGMAAARADAPDDW